MFYFVLLFGEIIFLFLISRSTSKALFRFLPENAVSFIFFPGTVIHEFSHFLMASLLSVPVGEMEFVPKKEGNSVKLGSVKIAKTDPVRRSLIGFAPVFAGLAVIIGTVYLFSSNIPFLNSFGVLISVAITLIFAYILFAVSNTMFSSKADMKGTLEFLIAISVVIGILYVLGIRIPWSFWDKMFVGKPAEIVRQSTFFLGVSIAVDLIVLGLAKFFVSIRNQK